MKRIPLFSMSCLALCGCASSGTLVQWDAKEYEPSAITRPEVVATLSNKRIGAGTVGETGLYLRKVDGVSTATAVMRDQLVRLNPGAHTADIRCERIEAPDVRLVFTATPKTRYKVEGRVLQDRVEVWIENVESKEHVSEVAVAPFQHVNWPIFTGR